ncbi:MAG: hypothetical protein HZB16_01050 [Armatimonadetes bacterium]|nr:hypothetical protein [Armatimonadota bacterium]
MPLSTWLQRWLCVALWLLAVASPSVAQPATPRAEPTFPRLEGARFHWHDQPVLLSYAFGLRDPAQLEAYARLGLNTVYVDLTGDPAADAAARDLADAASRRGLAVIVGLNAITAAAGPGALSTADRARLAAMDGWLTATVTAWADQPGVVAWALQHDAEENLAWAPAHFTAWLDQQYGSQLNLHAAWGRELPDETLPTPDLALAIDDARPGRCGRPTLDVARWRATSIAWLLRGWERTIHAVDPSRPVIGGRMSRGRTLLVAPEELAGLQPSMVPMGGAVVDPYELASLASQAGRFAPLVCLDATAPADGIRRLALRAAARGVAGLSFADWPALADDPLRQRAVAEVLAELATQQAAGFEQRGCSAIVLSPWAQGPALYGAGWYGYSSIGGEEPAGLLALLRGGTRFGPLDVITPRDLMARGADAAASTYRVDLSGYGCVFVPAGYFLSEDQVARLAQYAEAGGTVLADFGVASEGFRGVEPSMSRSMAGLLGVAPRRTCSVFEVALSPALRARLRKVAPGEDPLALLPTGLPGPGALVVDDVLDLCPRLRIYDSVGRRAARAQLLAPATFVLPAPDTRVVAMQCQIGGRVPTEAPSAGLFARPVGHGNALFASGPLWNGFGPDDPLFEALHEGLLSRRSSIETVLDVAPGQATWAARGEGRVWLDRTAPSPGLVAVDLPDMDGLVYTNGLNIIRRARRDGKPGAEPLINRLVTGLAAGEMRCESALPMTLWPLDTAAGAQVTAYGPNGIEVWLFGAGAGVATDGPMLAVADPREVELMLTVHGGAYPIEPGSLHRIELQQEFVTPRQQAPGQPFGGASRGVAGSRSHNTQYRTLNADPDGRLVIRGMVQVTRLRIKPASARWED